MFLLIESYVILFLNYRIWTVLFPIKFQSTKMTVHWVSFSSEIYPYYHEILPISTELSTIFLSVTTVLVVDSVLRVKDIFFFSFNLFWNSLFHKNKKYYFCFCASSRRKKLHLGGQKNVFCPFSEYPESLDNAVFHFGNFVQRPKHPLKLYTRGSYEFSFVSLAICL